MALQQVHVGISWGIAFNFDVEDSDACHQQSELALQQVHVGICWNISQRFSETAITFLQLLFFVAFERSLGKYELSRAEWEQMQISK